MGRTQAVWLQEKATPRKKPARHSWDVRLCRAAKSKKGQDAGQSNKTKQNINNVLNSKEITHNLSFNNTELISKCEEIDDR